LPPQVVAEIYATGGAALPTNHHLVRQTNPGLGRVVMES
jgi:hypothetical protein